MRKLVTAALAAGLLAVPAAGLAQASPEAGAAPRGLNVEIDRAQRVQLRAPAASVIVANPAVADVTVVDASLLFITGRGYGSTEVVAVDGVGRTLWQAVVTVGAPAQGHVRLWRAGEPTEMTCGAGCAPSPRQAGGPGGAP